MAPSRSRTVLARLGAATGASSSASATRRLGGDSLGVDVNVAARMADAAKPGEVLASAPALEGWDTDGLILRRRRWFRAKGAPRELDVR